MAVETMSVALHSSSTIFSPRHVPSWLLLAFGAGSVNAGAFLACERFVTHVTGTVTRLGLDAGLWTLMLDYGIVLGCFIAGAMASVLALDARFHRGKAPLHALPLGIVATMLVGVALAGRLGAFGAFGQTVETAGAFALLSLLGFAMGLQNAAVASTTGLAIRTTHMTGPASDLGVHLASAYFTSGEARRAALRMAAPSFLQRRDQIALEEADDRRLRRQIDALRLCAVEAIIGGFEEGVGFDRDWRAVGAKRTVTFGFSLPVSLSG